VSSAIFVVKTILGLSIFFLDSIDPPSVFLLSEFTLSILIVKFLD